MASLSGRLAEKILWRLNILSVCGPPSNSISASTDPVLFSTEFFYFCLMKQSLFKFLHGIFFILCVDLIGAGLWSWAVVRSFEDSAPKVPMAVVLSHDFNNEGKIVYSHVYASSNHFEDL